LRAAFSIDGAARVAESRDGPDRPTANAGALEASPEPQHAFVGAFSAFNLSLLALGTPANLIRVSAAAALDEMFHPKACFALASRHTGRTLSPAELDISGLTLATDLVSVASAALVAQASFERCDDPRVRSVLQRIAEDEAPRRARIAAHRLGRPAQR
jgi:hypothetical protein